MRADSNSSVALTCAAGQANPSAATMVAIVVGFVVRMVFLVLTPTLYGVPNDLLYIDNHTFGAGFDGWATIVAFAISLAAFVATALVTSHSGEEELALVEADRFAPVAAEPDAAPA